MKPEAIDENPLTAGGLAKKLGRSRWGVKMALSRLNIAPLMVLGKVSYYPESVLPRLEEEMRKATPLL